MLVKIKDCNDSDYDFYLEAPAHMDGDAAIHAVDGAIRRCTEDLDYTQEDLMRLLSPLGFSAPVIVVANEEF